jgi:D-alanyl-D-alanine carboxypeptidase/D-alanyl-D-alanine-endopeptidase (penicillin-binding protein 4)
LNRRGRIALRVIATVMLMAGIACAVASTRSVAEASPPLPNVTSAAKDPTPILSARRWPALFNSSLEQRQLQRSIDFAFAHENACLAVDDTSAHPLARQAADAPLAPASTQKLLTGAAALAVLGPQHTFTTRAATNGRLVGNTLTGNLYVVGGGDPVLATPAFVNSLRSRALTSTEPVTPLTSLADAIVGAGVRLIRGAVVGDDSRHDRLRFLPVWKPNYRTEGDIGALSALGVDHGYATPGGSVAPADPALATAQQLVAMLVARGVSIDDGAASGSAPARVHDVAHIESPPLAALVAGMLTASDNWIAETLVREIGVAVAHHGGTAAGTAAVMRVLAARHISMKHVSVFDGSGLAPSNRVTCAALVGVIDLARNPRFAAIDRGLAVAGRTGTLATRFLGDPLQGVLRAKTGHIDGVAALAGVVDDAEHLRFAFVVNGQFGTVQGQALQAQAARLVAAYPQLPAGTLIPTPGE